MKRWRRFMGSLVLVVGCEFERASTVQDDPLDYEIATSAHAGECTVVFEPTGVSLRSDLSGTIPDPNPYWVSRDREGRFYAGITPDGGRVAVWSADGTFVQTIGRPGNGPGELGPSPFPIVDDRDHLHVLDSTQGLWSRFTTDGRFLSSTRSPAISHIGLSGTIAIVGEDSVLTSEPSRVFSSHFQFHILNSDGSVERAFGELPDAPDAGNWLRSAPKYSRSIAFTGGRTFWAAPWHGSEEDEYVLEEWTLDGNLVRRLRREVPWRLHDALPNEDEAGGRYPFFRLALGPQGHLIVSAMFELDGGGREHWFEVIDPQVPELLASGRVQTERPAVAPRFGMFTGLPLGIQGTPTELDLPVIDIVRYRLAPKGDAGDDSVYECS